MSLTMPKNNMANIRKMVNVPKTISHGMTRPSCSFRNPKIAIVPVTNNTIAYMNENMAKNINTFRTRLFLKKKTHVL